MTAYLTQSVCLEMTAQLRARGESDSDNPHEQTIEGVETVSIEINGTEYTIDELEGIMGRQGALALAEFFQDASGVDEWEDEQ